MDISNLTELQREFEEQMQGKGISDQIMNEMIDGDTTNVNFQKSIEQAPFMKMRDDLEDEEEINCLKDMMINGRNSPGTSRAGGKSRGNTVFDQNSLGSATGRMSAEQQETLEKMAEEILA